MRHAFLDRYSDLDSPIHRLDPRVKLAVFAAILLVMISVPRYEPLTLVLCYPGLAVLVAFSRVPVSWFLRRCLIVTPFVLMAAGVMMLTGETNGRAASAAGVDLRSTAALSIVLKAYAAVIVLSLLTSTERFHRLLEGMRRLGLPPLPVALSAYMYRYAFILSEEVMRTSRARLSRTPGSLRTGAIRTYGNQAAMIFIRSWERSQMVYHAMCSRGFTGEIPRASDLRPHTRRSGRGDLLFALLVPAAFLAVRLWG
jgi:cobalt/nickel transport system permease protein